MNGLKIEITGGSEQAHATDINSASQQLVLHDK